MATQILMPVVPFVHRDFNISVSAAQLLITMVFLAIAPMTRVHGPLSDRHGRRDVLRTGIALFVAGSLLSVLAQSMTALVPGPVLQAAGSSAGLVLARIVVHDVCGREYPGRVLAHVIMLMILMPVLSPVIGGVLLDHDDRRTGFAFCHLVGLLNLSLPWAAFPLTCEERRPADCGALNSRHGSIAGAPMLALQSAAWLMRMPTTPRSVSSGTGDSGSRNARAMSAPGPTACAMIRARGYAAPRQPCHRQSQG